jgi:Zn-dependent peptidase ImmA (M78 family)
MHPSILEKKANEFRLQNGLTQQDNIRLKSLLSKLNVLTVFKPLGESLFGMAIKVGEGSDTKRFILVNTNTSLGHQHFTICHEIYHLFIQAVFTSMVCHTGLFNRSDREEYHADLFASYLLLPQAGIESLIPDHEFPKDKISLQTILKIEQYFSCSRSALLYRLKKLGFISEMGYERYNKNVKRSAIQYGYSTDLYQPGNHDQVVGDYGTLAKILFDEGKISESHYFSLLLDLGMNVEEIENLNHDEE